MRRLSYIRRGICVELEPLHAERSTRKLSVAPCENNSRVPIHWRNEGFSIRRVVRRDFELLWYFLILRGVFKCCSLQAERSSLSLELQAERCSLWLEVQAERSSLWDTSGNARWHTSDVKG